MLNRALDRSSVLQSAAILIAVATVALLVFAALRPTATLAGHGAPGNNGTIKVHDGPQEPDPEVRNQPHVCLFDLHFFFGDPLQAGSWWIVAWPPTGDGETVVLEGTYQADETGEARVPDEGYFQLEDGHYKLFWEGAENPGGQTNIKHKVFWVACPDEVGEATPTPTPTQEVEATPTPTPAPEVEATPTPTPTQEIEASPTPTPTPEVDATPTPTPEVVATPTQTPEGQVAGETGTPAPTGEQAVLPDTAAVQVSSSLLAALFAAALLLSLFAIAGLNAAAVRRRR